MPTLFPDSFRLSNMSDEEGSGDGRPGGTGPASGSGSSGVPLETMEWWDDLETDAAETAAEYEERGWETLQLHTSDVTPLDGEYGDRVGLSVLVPDNEFEALTDRLDDGDVTNYEVYRTAVGGYVALLVVLEDEPDGSAVLFPAYYASDDDRARRLFEQATADGELTVSLRRLSDERVDVTLSNPELLAPSSE